MQSGADKQQREYFLRKQMESIQRELGEDSASVVEEYRAKIADAGMPEEVAEQANKELGRLERMGEQSAEATTIRSYLDWLITVPWRERSEEKLDPADARDVLDADHAGLEDVKDRIVEYLAVKKLRDERGIKEDKRSGAILTLDRPARHRQDLDRRVDRARDRPRSSSACRSAASATRPRSAAHRRTYIGALPGRLVRALRDAGTMNPVIMLDEVDKVGADWRGDPSVALLEVLDPAQNHAFRDHYLDVELDLSEVMFIATANVAETIPGPLLDRMEVIRFDGYTVAEKTAIARDYLWPRQRERTACARTRSRSATSCCDGRQRVHPRGGRAQPRARARHDPAQDRHEGRLEQGRRPRSTSVSTSCATRSGARRSSRRRRCAPRSRAWPPASP